MSLSFAEHHERVTPDLPALPRPEYRPALHFTARRNWLNDPNGLVYAGGAYHLFYQHNPFANEHGYMSWGHATSPDLLHWTEREVALPWTERHDVFSGSAVMDWRNTSGAGQPGDPHPPLVAMYTGSRDGRQAQYLAFSRDAGRTWLPRLDAVLDEGKQDFRDPKTFWHAPTGRWVSVVVHPNERQVGVYGSADLHTWEPLSTFGPAGGVAGIWEVPDLFPLTDADGAERWVMKVDVFAGGPQGGVGAQVWVGDFDGVTFTPRTPARWADWGKDFYAAVTFSDLPAAQERRVWLGWMNSWEYANVLPTTPWRGAMTLPRELGLRPGPDGLPWLTQAPARELLALRETPHDLNGTLNLPPGTPLEVVLPGGQDFRLVLGSAWDDEAWLDVQGDTLTFQRPQQQHTADLPGFAGTHRAPLPAPGGEWRIFVDRCSVEVFGCGGLLSFTALLLPSAPLDRLTLHGAEGVVYTLRPSMPSS